MQWERIIRAASLNIMPFENYGPMWQRVAQFTPSQYVKDRIDSIRNIAPNWPVDNFNLQSLYDANGTVVNCDLFPVRITQLPPGMTPEDITEYFRKNINSFIDASLNVSFNPYQDGSFYDTAKFNAPFENSLGPLINIHMPDNGSVIESDYYHDYTLQKHRFKFSTMETPADHDHPVSGNREFGIYADPAHPGEYSLYTMGVDRTSDWMYSVLNWADNTVFDGADKLWSNIQKNMIQFINANGGSASYYYPQRIAARPKWGEVYDYLRGFQTFAQLKQKLGC